MGSLNSEKVDGNGKFFPLSLHSEQNSGKRKLSNEIKRGRAFFDTLILAKSLFYIYLQILIEFASLMVLNEIKSLFPSEDGPVEECTSHLKTNF